MYTRPIFGLNFRSQKILELKRIEKNIEGLNKKVYQMDSTSIKQEQMVKIIKETPNWKTLEIEELSDKNKIPVNYYKNMDK